MPAVSWNATASNMAVTNSIDGGSLLWIVLLIAAIGGLIVLITSIERYTAFFNAIEKIIQSVKYALYGSGIAASGYALYAMCKLVASASSGFDPIAIGYLIGGYVVLVAIGYIGERIAKRIKAMHGKYLEAKNKSATIEASP